MKIYFLGNSYECHLVGYYSTEIECHVVERKTVAMKMTNICISVNYLVFLISLCFILHFDDRQRNEIGHLLKRNLYRCVYIRSVGSNSHYILQYTLNLHKNLDKLKILFLSVLNSKPLAVFNSK